MLATMMRFPLTLDHFVARAERLFGQVEVVSRRPDGQRVRHSYGAICQRARALAGALVAAGLEKGDRVGTLMWNHHAHLEAYLGLPLAGGVLHTLNLRLHDSELAYIVGHARDRFVIVDDVLWPLWAKVQERLAPELRPQAVIVHEQAGGLPAGASVQAYEAFLGTAGRAGSAALPALGEEDAAGLCYTSGTTGQPKGVAYSHLDREPGRYRLEPGLRMIVGGSAAPEALIRGFDRHGLSVLHAWGMTEMSPLGTVSRVKSTLAGLSEDERYALRAKQGLPVPLVEARARGEQGEAIPWDGRALGELEVRGPFVAAGYHARDDSGDRWTEDGWFRTGDVVTIDAEGYIKIADRTTDLIKSGGEWISSVDLENALMGPPAVREAAVIAVPHPKWQERPLAVVVLKEGQTATPEELRAFLEPRFARFWLPDRFEFASEIPRTSAGKFLKSALRARYAT